MAKVVQPGVRQRLALLVIVVMMSVVISDPGQGGADAPRQPDGFRPRAPPRGPRDL